VSSSFAFEFAQARVANTEMVGDFVNDDLANAVDELIVVASCPFNWALEDGNAIGRDHAIARVALRERYPLVESEQRSACRYSGSRELAAAGPVLHLDIYVIHALRDLIGHRRERPPHQLFEVLTFHN